MAFVHPTYLITLMYIVIIPWDLVGNIHLNRISSKSESRSFSYASAELFNDLPDHVKNSDSMRSFTSNYWFEK